MKEKVITIASTVREPNLISTWGEINGIFVNTP
jgi:hypothetical protein